MTKIKVFVLEDSHCFYQGIRSWLEGDKHFSLFNRLVGWTEFLELANNEAVSILITSLQWINSKHDIAALTKFLKLYPHIHVMCFIQRYVEYSLQMLLNSNVRGIIDWDSTSEEFLFGLKTVAEGKIYVSSQIPEEQFMESVIGNKKIVENVSLTHREKEVLLLIAQGLTDRVIGDRLCLSKRTVNGYRANLLSKFGTRNSALMVKVAFENQLL